MPREAAITWFEELVLPLRDMAPGSYVGVGGRRSIPVIEGDRVAGIKRFGIRPGSTESALGIQNGDVILRVADLAIETPKEQAEIVARLRNSKVVVVELRRFGSECMLVEIDFENEHPRPYDVVILPE